ncbi:hypothetical protein LTR17_025121 [Elasticomyces elasticus]|nr:hypothetical protein LTR17_025121 [Elasticomyces elasticus]
MPISRSVDVFSSSTPSVAISSGSTPIPSSTISSTVPNSSSSSATSAVASATPTGKVPNLGQVVGGSPTDTVSQLFWVNYAEAIREIAGIQIGDNNAFYLGTQAQKGPLAGSYIPDQYSNQGLYQIANNLLNTSTMFYTPDSAHGYVQALSNYLDNVDLEGHPSPSQQISLLNALKNQDSAQDAEAYQLDLANKKYLKELSYGLHPDQSFGDWLLVSGNAPGYATAQRAAQQAANDVDSIQITISGTKSIAWSNDRELIRKASDITTNQTG